MKLPLVRERVLATNVPRLVPVLVAGVLGLEVWLSAAGHRPTLPHPAVLSHKLERVADERCAECHSDIVEAFQSTSHSRTLSRATEAAAIDAFAGRSYQRSDSGVRFDYRMHEGELFVESSAFGRPMRIDWVFGSGTHARTPLITWMDHHGNTSAIEHSVSWYPDGQLGVTLGLDEVPESSGVLALGHPRSPAETINCFGCHCTFVPADGERIQFDQLQPGIGCSRCHWNAAQHVSEMEQGRESTIETLALLSPRQSVDRCGECHRRADEVGRAIEPDEPTIVRFASVGLTQSVCFTRQHEVRLGSGKPVRLDCVSCHNPHRQETRDWQSYASVCWNCHDAARNGAVACSKAAARDNCIQCHMPTVPANDHLSFTDHWIRIRNEK